MARLQFWKINLLISSQIVPCLSQTYLLLDDCFERNIDRPHRGRVHVTYSAAACQKMCQEIGKCKYFTWRKDNKQCWLKKEKGGSRPNENAISGPKYC